MFSSIDTLRAEGFSGFHTIRELHADYKLVPKRPGVYMILNCTTALPVFVHPGSAGFHKNRDPNQAIEILRTKWIKGAMVLYIGKAGGINQTANLQGRINQYLRHGRGHAAAHWGGRYIWQLKHCNSLLICWKEITHKDPRQYEKRLIEMFRNEYGGFPFANLCR